MVEINGKKFERLLLQHEFYRRNILYSMLRRAVPSATIVAISVSVQNKAANQWLSIQLLTFPNQQIYLAYLHRQMIFDKFLMSLDPGALE